MPNDSAGSQVSGAAGGGHADHPSDSNDIESEHSQLRRHEFEVDERRQWPNTPLHENQTDKLAAHLLARLGQSAALQHADGEEKPAAHQQTATEQEDKKMRLADALAMTTVGQMKGGTAAAALRCAALRC